MIGAAKMGMDYRSVAPYDLQPKSELVAQAVEIANETGARLTFTGDVESGVKDCAEAPTSSLTRTLASPKRFARVAADTAVRVRHSDEGTAVLSSLRSALPGAAFILRGVPAVRLPRAFIDRGSSHPIQRKAAWLRNTCARSTRRTSSPRQSWHARCPAWHPRVPRTPYQG